MATENYAKLVELVASLTLEFIRERKVIETRLLELEDQIASLAIKDMSRHLLPAKETPPCE
jgi:hypothetical protein